MDTLHPQMMQGINTGHTDDEMMDSEFDNQVQPDDDYDIDLDVADAFSNNADEEMKEDVPVSYDNDDVMVDEVEFQTQPTQLVPETQPPHEEMIFSQMHPAHPLERQEYRQFNITETTQVPATSAADAVITDTTTETVAEQTLASLEPVAVESAEVTIEVTQESKDVPAITVTDVPNVENSGAEAVQTQSNNPESEQNEQENGAVPSTEVSKGAEEGDAAAVRVASPHGEAQDGDNQAADTNPTTERRDSIASNAEVQKIHPVIVQFGSEILALFNAQYYINYNDTPDNPASSTSNGFPAAFLVSDFSLYNKGFDEVFAVLRELFGPSIGDDAELTLEFDGLELFLHEDNSMSGNITPCELVDLYVRLSLQDKVQHPDPLYIVLATQPRFTKRYSELLSAAGDGKGLSAVATYSTPADEHHDEDDNKQSYGQSENKDGEFEESQNLNETEQNKPGQGDAQEEEFEQVDHAQDEEEDIPDLTEEEQQQLQIADDSLLMLGGVAPVIEGNNKNTQITDKQPQPVQEEDDDELLPEEDQLEAEGNPVAAEAQENSTEKADTTKTSEPKSTDDNKDHSQKVDENSQSVGQESKDNLIEETQSQTIQEASIDVNANDHTDIEDVGENEFLDYDPSELPPAVEGKDDYNEQTEAQAEDVSPRQEDEEYEQAEGNEGENNEDEDGEYVEDDTFYTVGTSHTVTINSSNADVDYEDQSFVSAVVVTGASPTSHGSPESGTVIAQTPASDKLQPIPSYQGNEEPDAEDELRSYQDEDEPRAGSQEPDYEHHEEGDENWDENTAEGGSFEENENQLEGNGEEEEDAEYEDDDGDYTAEGEENRGLTNESTDGTVPVSEGGVEEGEKTSPQEEEVLEEYDDAGSYEDFQRQFDAQEKLREMNSPVNKRERADDDELYEYETHDVKRTRSD